MQTTEPITAKSVEASDAGLILRLADREVRVPWASCSGRLARASAQQRSCLELSPGGYGIHWPLIDEDLSITGLIGRGEATA